MDGIVVGVPLDSRSDGRPGLLPEQRIDLDGERDKMLGEHPNVGVNTLKMNIGMTLLFIDLGGERRLDIVDLDGQRALDADDPGSERCLDACDLASQGVLDACDLASQPVLDATNVCPQRIDDFSGFDVHENLEPILTSSDAAAELLQSILRDQSGVLPRFISGGICQPRDLGEWDVRCTRTAATTRQGRSAAPFFRADATGSRSEMPSLCARLPAERSLTAVD